MSNQDENEKPRADWGQLAQEALDLWQSHLTSLASDTAAKDEMAQFVAPMSQMFSQWTTMMQSGFASVMPQDWGGTASAPSTDDQETPFTAASPETTTEAAQTGAEPVAQTAPQDEPSKDQPLESLPTNTASTQNQTEAKAPEVTAAAPVAVSPIVYVPNKEEESLAPPSKPAPVVERPTDIAKSVHGEQGVRRRAALADGTGDLAQLAGRLAKLERELETLRARPKRSASDGSAVAEPDADAEGSAVGDDERVARARS
jgi:hypothetical protein